MNENRLGGERKIVSSCEVFLLYVWVESRSHNSLCLHFQTFSSHGNTEISLQQLSCQIQEERQHYLAQPAAKYWIEHS